MKFDTEKLEAAHHEVGHWVIANYLGFKTGKISIEIKHDKKSFGHNGSSKIFPRLDSNSIKEIDLYLKNRIAVLFSGVIAQSICMKNREKYTAANLLKSTGLGDHKKIMELLPIYRGIRFPDASPKDEESQTLDIHTECWTYSDNLVQKNINLISHIAGKISMEIISTNKSFTFEFEKLNSLKDEFNKIN